MYFWLLLQIYPWLKIGFVVQGHKYEFASEIFAEVATGDCIYLYAMT